MNKAEIKNNVIINVIIVDPNDIPEWCANWPTITNEGIGWTWDGASFHEPLQEVEP